MYVVDGRDRVVELVEIPPCEPGAPTPVVVAEEGRLELAYRGRPNSASAGVGADRWEAVLVRFVRPYAVLFGPPNDEALNGHPLWQRGLRHYAAHRVEDSSWIRACERMNAVHPHHSPQSFSERRHFVFTFHDSTFECIAHDLTINVGGDVTVSARLDP